MFVELKKVHQPVLRNVDLKTFLKEITGKSLYIFGTPLFFFENYGATLFITPPYPIPPSNKKRDSTRGAKSQNKMGRQLFDFLYFLRLHDISGKEEEYCLDPTSYLDSL